ncbi:MAG TPA: peptidylprolyl isomerase [Phaeodactylibacter sp.]|nr:peptidylprolyl isomerase [Phaeodactylibacter sp.]
MKKIGLLFLVVMMASGLFAQDKKVIDKIVANVGNEYVLLSDLEQIYAQMSEEKGYVPEEAKCNLLENLIASSLMLNQAKLDSIEVSDEEVEAQLNARIEQILGWMGGDVKQFEEFYGQSTAEVKSRFRSDLENKLLIERMQQQVMAGAKVTPSEVKAFYDRIPKDSLPYFNSEVELGEIVYKPQINAEEKAKTKAALESIRTRIIEGGEDFAELAKKYSADLGSGRQGGDLGWAKRGSYVPEFEATAYNLEENQYSEVIETDFGYHFMQLLGRRGNSIHVRHILLRPELTEADKEAALLKLDTIRNLILTDSVSFSLAVKLFSDKDQQSYNNDGRMVNPKTGNTFFEIADLEPDIFFTIDTMKVGDISAPIEFDNRGDLMYRLIYLQSRTDPHQANLKQDYSKIRTAAIEERKAQFMSDWVEEKIGSTFIYIDKSYQGCPNLEKWQKDGIKP